MTLRVDEAHVQVPAGEGGRGTPFNIDYCGLFNLLMKALWHLLCAKNMQMPHVGQRGRRATNYVQRQVLSWREIYRNEELKKKKKENCAAHAASSRGKKGGRGSFARLLCLLI